MKETRQTALRFAEALDQLGATLGPLLVSLALVRHGTFQSSFRLLLIPALLPILVIGIARYLFAHPQHPEAAPASFGDRLSRHYRLNVAAGACIAAGFADSRLLPTISSMPGLSAQTSFHFTMQSL